jgi:hypothetical protein
MRSLPTKERDAAAGPARARARQAFVEGWRRTVKAPATLVSVWTVVAGLTALGRLVAKHGELGLPPTLLWDAEMGFAQRLVAPDSAKPAAGALLVTGLVAWLWAAGGVLQRLGRAQPIGQLAFLRASRTYFPRFLRQSALVVFAYWVLLAGLGPWVFNAAPSTPPGVQMAGAVLLALLLTAVMVLADFAKVRTVMEDRHSAIGALVAALRFIRRRLARIVAMTVLYLMLVFVLGRIWVDASPAIGMGLMLVLGQALLLWVRLALVASEAAFFQLELSNPAVATTDPTWPDAPEAEPLGGAGRR